MGKVFINWGNFFFNFIKHCLLFLYNFLTSVSAEKKGALNNFEKFASLNGPNFYNVSPNKEKLKLVSRPNKIKEFIDVVEEKNIVGQIKPFHAGETLQWHVEGIIN